MIPISQDEKIPVVIDGITYHVKPLCGDNELAQSEIVTRYEGMEQTKKSRWLMMDEVVDLILVGWEGKGLKDFPKGGNPSKYLKAEVKMKLVEAAGEASGLSGEEIKN